MNVLYNCILSYTMRTKYLYNGSERVLNLLIVLRSIFLKFNNKFDSI